MTDREVNLLTIEDNNEDAGLAIHALKRSHIDIDIVPPTGGSQALDFTFSNGGYSGRNIQHFTKYNFDRLKAQD